jgi:hypothetical protein
MLVDTFCNERLLSSLESKTIADQMLAHFILPNGLPKLVLIDEDSLFKTEVIEVLGILQIAYHVVSPEPYEGIVCKRYHRYLNKVQKINGIQTVDYQEWMKNVVMAGYAWNVTPINGTNIVRSFTAKGRRFWFWLDVVDEPLRLSGLSGNPATRVVEHVETVFPAWKKQSEILKVVLEE